MCVVSVQNYISCKQVQANPGVGMALSDCIIYYHITIAFYITLYTLKVQFRTRHISHHHSHWYCTTAVYNHMGREGIQV